MNTDRIAYFLAVVREGSVQAEQQRRQLLHDEKTPFPFLNVSVQGRHSGCSARKRRKQIAQMNWEIALFFSAIFPYPWKNAPLYASNPLKSP